jgi:hypothetical protein
MVPSEIKVFDQEIALLDVLVQQLAGTSGGQVAAAASSSSAPSQSTIQAVTLRLILMMRCAQCAAFSSGIWLRRIASSARSVNSTQRIQWMSVGT